MSLVCWLHNMTYSCLYICVYVWLCVAHQTIANTSGGAGNISTATGTYENWQSNMLPVAFNVRANGHGDSFVRWALILLRKPFSYLWLYTVDSLRSWAGLVASGMWCSQFSSRRGMTCTGLPPSQTWDPKTGSRCPTPAGVDTQALFLVGACMEMCRQYRNLWIVSTCTWSMSLEWDEGGWQAFTPRKW